MSESLTSKSTLFRVGYYLRPVNPRTSPDNSYFLEAAVPIISEGEPEANMLCAKQLSSSQDGQQVTGPQPNTRPKYSLSVE